MRSFTLALLLVAQRGAAQPTSPCEPMLFFISTTPLERSEADAVQKVVAGLEGAEQDAPEVLTQWALRDGRWQVAARVAGVADASSALVAARPTTAPATTDAAAVLLGPRGLVWLGGRRAVLAPLNLGESYYGLQAGGLGLAPDGTLWFAARGVGKKGTSDVLVMGPVPAGPHAPVAPARVNWTAGAPSGSAARFKLARLASSPARLMLGFTEYPARGPSRVRLAQVRTFATVGGEAQRVEVALVPAPFPGTQPTQLLSLQPSAAGGLLALVGVGSSGADQRLRYQVARWADGRFEWLGRPLGDFSTGSAAASLLETPQGELRFAAALAEGTRAALRVWRWDRRLSQWAGDDAGLARLAEPSRFHNDPLLWLHDEVVYLSWIGETAETGYSSVDAFFQAAHEGTNPGARAALKPVAGRAVQVAALRNNRWTPVPIPSRSTVRMVFGHTVATCEPSQRRRPNRRRMLRNRLRKSR